MSTGESLNSGRLKGPTILVSKLNFMKITWLVKSTSVNNQKIVNKKSIREGRTQTKM